MKSQYTFQRNRPLKMNFARGRWLSSIVITMAAAT